MADTAGRRMMTGKMEDAARKVQRAKDYRAAQNVDPDWWVKELIIREKLTGLAPEPFLLRKVDAELDGQLKAEASEAGVRQLLEEFNQRVIRARRQLLGGPPVITRTRDIEAEIARWRAERSPRRPLPAESVREIPPVGSPSSVDREPSPVNRGHPPRWRGWWRRPGR